MIYHAILYYAILYFIIFILFHTSHNVLLQCHAIYFSLYDTAFREPNCSAKNMASYAWFKILSYKFYVWNTWTRQLCFENVRVPGPQSLPYYNIYCEAKIDYHVCIRLDLFVSLLVCLCLSVSASKVVSIKKAADLEFGPPWKRNNPGLMDWPASGCCQAPLNSAMHGPLVYGTNN